MAFRVNPTPAVDPVVLPATLRAPIVPLTPTAQSRQLLLFEGVDAFGRIMSMLGTVVYSALQFTDSITKNPVLKDTEVWEIYNTTGDGHPIHLHLVQFQILNPQRFRSTQDPVTGELTNITLQGTAHAPRKNKMGFKDTAVMLPGTVTRVIAKFDRPWALRLALPHPLSHVDH